MADVMTPTLVVLPEGDTRLSVRASRKGPKPSGGGGNSRGADSSSFFMPRGCGQMMNHRSVWLRVSDSGPKTVMWWRPAVWRWCLIHRLWGSRSHLAQFPTPPHVAHEGPRRKRPSSWSLYHWSGVGVNAGSLSPDFDSIRCSSWWHDGNWCIARLARIFLRFLSYVGRFPTSRVPVVVHPARTPRSLSLAVCHGDRDAVTDD